MKGLAEEYNYDVYQFSFIEKEDSVSNISIQPKFIHEIRLAKDISLPTRIVNIFRYSFLGENLPLQCALYLSIENERALIAYASEIKPNIVIVDMIRLAPYYKCFSDINCLKILNLCDLLSRRYEGQIASPYTPELLGSYANNLPRLLYHISKIFTKRILHAEIKRLKLHESRFTRMYDKSTLVSDVETKYINALLGETRALTVSLGVDDSCFVDALFDKDDNTVSFVGNFSVSANIASLELIIDRVLPLISSKVRLKVYGNCPNFVSEKYKCNNRVIFEGFVEDLCSALSKSSVFVSPIAFGSGIKTKILQAMAVGLPVVTNSIGVEGIGAVSGEHLFVEENVADIARRVNDLLRDKEFATLMGQNGKQFAWKNFRWKHIWKTFEKIGL
jgi:glycosyltransferase involved in cell wall biosynthesis